MKGGIPSSTPMHFPNSVCIRPFRVIVNFGLYNRMRSEGHRKLHIGIDSVFSHNSGWMWKINIDSKTVINGQRTSSSKISTITPLENKEGPAWYQEMNWAIIRKCATALRIEPTSRHPILGSRSLASDSGISKSSINRYGIRRKKILKFGSRLWTR
jgi:hypothetical protein